MAMSKPPRLSAAAARDGPARSHFPRAPIRDPSGKRTGTFNSVWRREKDGRWKVVFDKGCPPCDCGN